MKWFTTRPQIVCFIALAFFLCFLASPVLGKTKSIFSPIIDVDKKLGLLFVSSDSGIVIVQASEAAKPHLGKLPIGGMIDVVVEYKKGSTAPILKSWKVVAGESECKVFDGKECK